MKTYYSMTSSSVHSRTPISASSGLHVPDFIFAMTNEILTLKNLYLDIQESILESDLSSVPCRTPGSAFRYHYCQK